jgi:ABC-2 type transport system ATP-binding protein
VSEPAAGGPTKSSAVRLEDVGKRYVKYEDAPMLLTRALRFRPKNKRSDLWAIRHVNLDVAPATTIGVIGRNGSGKSTLLRMLAGVTAPTEGCVTVHGRVAPLISVGVGFHPELTGRENVYVNGAILGMTRQEIDARFDSIVDFSEIRDFIDTPVKFYSSGMFVRLGFAVAVAAEPDVLLVDEVLAVGDLAFQVKCFSRMHELQAAGTTVLVVSHNLNAIRNLCSDVLVLHDGQPAFYGPTNEGLSVYHDLLDSGAQEGSGGGSEQPVEDLRLELWADGKATSHVNAGDDIVFRITGRCVGDLDDLDYSISISTEGGIPVYGDNTHVLDARPVRAGAELRCDVALRAALTTGSYSARAGVSWGPGRENSLGTRHALFYVSGRRMVQGVADLGAEFDFIDNRPLTPDAG